MSWNYLSQECIRLKIRKIIICRALIFENKSRLLKDKIFTKIFITQQNYILKQNTAYYCHTQKGAKILFCNFPPQNQINIKPENTSLCSNLKMCLIYLHHHLVHAYNLSKTVLFSIKKVIS